MSTVPSLDAADYSGLPIFTADFLAILGVAKGLDRYYGLGKPNLDIFLPKFRKTLSLFNKKYKDISLALKKKNGSLHLNIAFLGEESLQSLFANSLSRIKGLSAIGLKKFDEVPLSEQDKVEKTLSKMGKEAYVTYSDPESGTARLAIERHGNQYVLICSPKELLIKSSPEFRLSAYYALRHPLQKKIDVLSHASGFGFSDSIGLEPTELSDKFEPFWRSY